MFEIRNIETKTEIDDFHKVAALVYSGDMRYISPLRSDIEDVFSRNKNPAFIGGDAQRFVLYENEKPIGRAAVFYQTKTNGLKMGGMGFFDCVNNKEMAFAIFDYCAAWLKEHGCEYMDGPTNFGDRDSFWGLLVECNVSPSYRENYNPAYYQALFEDYGFVKIIEQSTSDISHDVFNYERFSKLAERVMKNPKYKFLTLDFNQLTKFASDFVEIYNLAWAHHEDFKALTTDKVVDRLKQIKPVLDPSFAIFAYADDKPIAFYVNILEVNQVFRRFKGKLTFWNKLQFLYFKRKIDKLRAIVFGVVPEFHNLGIETGLIMKFRESYLRSGRIKNVELAWVGDFNAKMLSMLKSLGASTTKVHNTYRKIF